MNTQMETLLNHLGNTAVYVVRQDTHEILYFNDQVKRVTPEVRLGSICHVLWKGACDFCPLNGIEGKETHTSIGYDDPFGDVVDITATRMNWGDEQIPAFLISVTPRMVALDEQKEVEKQLRLERAAIYDSLPGSVVKILIRETPVILEASRTFYDSFGSPEEFQRDGWHGIYPEDRQAVRDKLLKCAAAGEPVTIEYRVVNRMGGVGWIHGAGKKVSQKDGFPVYQLVLLDITSRKQMQLALEQKQMEYRLAVENTADVLFEYDPAEDQFISHATGGENSSEEIIEHYLARLPDLQIIHPDDLKTVREIMAGGVRRAEIRLREPHRSDYTWMLYQGDVLWKNGKILKIIGTLRDITELRLREQTLKKQEHLIATTLDTVISSAFDEVLYFDLTRDELVFVRCNDVYNTKADLQNPGFERNIIATLHPEDQEPFRRKFCSASLLYSFSQEQFHVSQEGLRKGLDGKYHWISMEAARLEDNSEGDRMALLLITTIDDKKRLEQESQIMGASILKMFGELIVLDLKTELYVTHRADGASAGLLEISEPAPFAPDYHRYGRHLIHPEDQRRFGDFFNLKLMREQVDKGKRKFFTEVRRKNEQGEYRWCEMIGTVIPNGLRNGYELLLTFRDVHELRMAQEEKRAANHRFMSAVNSFYDAIYEYDLYSGEVSVWKAPTERTRFLQCDAGDVECGRRERYVHPDYRQEFREKLDRKSLIEAFQSEKTEAFAEFPCEKVGGDYLWYAIQVQLLEKTPEKLRVMVYFKNVDEQRKAEERKSAVLRDALALAEQSNSAKSDFLSRMSHDMRTPINAIMGMTAIAQANDSNPDKIADCLEKIDTSARFLLSLINDVLDMSKIESGKMNITSESFDLRELLESLSTICGEQAKERRQSFEVMTEAEVGRKYMGDPLRIRQILMNLLSNAVKYTPNGGHISLYVEVQRETPELSYLQFRVVDDGIGMSEEFQKRLFEPFEQEEPGGGRVFEGSGLGLSITRNLVHLMNGNISVMSSPGKGSEFQISLPLRKAESQTADAAAGPPDKVQGPPDFHRERVLLVEDNVLNREIAQTLLEMGGLRVETAENGQIAVERFQASRPGYYQAVLMDIRMPVMNGLEATRAIRKLPRKDAGKIPIIAMTANAFQEEQQAARNAGISSYLTKPVEVDTLYSVLYESLAAAE